ncbi:MAG: TauD/TfdA family dioxygenase [Alphaproteobacteria bacterium]|nr:TauD/TfdA family dioxygenase [Alphaproteobacteria bacterium]
MPEVRPLSDRLGAEVAGVDLKSLDDDEFARIYDAFLQHIVLVFRDQDLTMEDFIAHGRRYGPLRPHIVQKSRHPVLPELMVMDNKIVDTKKGAEDNPSVNLVKRGAVWHTDTSYDYVTAKATQLYARAIPSTGGDTLFSNAYAIYDRLPAALKDRIEGLSATYKYGGRLKREVQLLEEEDRVRPAAVHALVRVHPETGRKAIYFNPGQVMDIPGLDTAESEDLIATLTELVESPDGDFRHTWRVGDLVIWDNRCLVHAATGDYPPEERRVHWRTTMMEPGWTPAADAEARKVVA